ncbi:hypothetical protein EPYR_00772 [Erwinia pyrifoliae DSM 12163]|nr:hypothetical protein EPYR_00772 [Erwinia pyrifoliae DSM 12163]
MVYFFLAHRFHLLSALNILDKYSIFTLKVSI